MTSVAKRAAGEAAAALVESGMVVGLGSGTTMRFAIEALAVRVREQGLRFVGVPTSVAAGALARQLGLALTELDGVLDLAIDGADEVEVGTFRLIKGLGGALLREKIVAESSRRFVAVATADKLVERLGKHVPVPVEVSRFGELATVRRLAALGAAPVLRRGADGAAFVTDGGNLIYDCGFGPIGDPSTLERRLRAIAGVLGTGLFLGPVEQALIGKDDGGVEVRRAG